MLLSYCFSTKFINRRSVSVIKAYTLRKNLHYDKSGHSSFRHYLLSSYMRFIERFTSILDKRFPTPMRVYRQFVWGTKDFYGELKDYIVVVKKKNVEPAGLRSLKRHELELYYKLPKDIAKITPLLVLSLLPFALNLVLPLVYCFPRQLLTSQFWNLQQRAEFTIHNQKKRVKWYKPVFRNLQAQLECVESHSCYNDWECVTRLIGSGLHPPPKQIIKCKPLFVGAPYHTKKICPSHVRSLLKMHGMGIMSVYPRSQLEYRAEMIHLMDLAIVNEGGVQALSLDEIRWACAFRGLNPANMKTEDMTEWLNSWIAVSLVVDENSWSLLLHCPILLSYNHPSNWVLIH